jgi:uncharacterized protein (TIGR02996 family)
LTDDPAEAALLAAVRAAPDDDGPKLVYADWLIERGDPRGELVALEHRDRTIPGGLELAALERLVELVGRLGFPRLAAPESQVDRLPWEGGGGFPVQYFLDWEGRSYYLRYRWGGFTVDVDDLTVVSCGLGLQAGGEWTAEETNVILSVVSRAIVEETPMAALEAELEALDLRAHPDHRAGRHPLYTAGVEARDEGRYRELVRRLQRLR